MKIKDYLESRQISRKEFAKMVGVATGTIINYINGHRQVTLEIALRIVKASNGKITLEDLCGLKK